MKSIPGKDFLSEEDLKKVLNGTADENIRKLLNDCELSKEAVEGYLAVPGAIATLPSIKKEISSKTGLNALSPMKQNLLALAFAAVVIGIPAYFLWPKSEDDDVANGLKHPIAQQLDPERSSANVAPILTPQSEHFVNPDAHPVPKFSPVKANNDTTGAALKMPITTADPIDVDPSQLLDEPPVVPTHPDVSYNSSIGFIYDLKITEYEKYNKIKLEVKDVELTGVSAAFDNADDQHNDANDAPTVREVPAEQFLKEGLLAFREMRYGKCIEKMEVLLQNDANDVNANFYIGVCYVKLELAAKALPYLDKVLAAKNNVFHEEAKWYEALALISEGNTEEAKKLLTDIISANGFYTDKAKDKLKELEK
ncbi:MAG TPA: hypothetical protein VL651_17365 [Bacteroidia bacterium]|jgi:hypothetical protein|nr:hypothetical protein [Bacteroidia bacterium]